MLVLSYFVSWGIRLNYQQDAQMRAFRLALASVVTEGELRPDAEATVALIEDKLVPDPRNMVGKGELSTVSGQGNVVWGNQMQKPMSLGAYDMPRLKYVINGVERDYSTAMAMAITNAMYDKIWVLLPDQVSRRQVQWGGAGNEIRCYKPTNSSPQQARFVISNPDLETEIITAVSETEDGILWYIIGFPETLNHGDPVSQFNVLMTEYGNLDVRFMNPDYVKEHADLDNDGIPDPSSENKLQGFLPGQSGMETRRKESLLIDDTTTKHESYTQFDTTGTTVTHHIRLNMAPLPLDFSYSPPEAAHKGSWVWTTSK